MNANPATLRFGIVGLGAMGRLHFARLHQRPRSVVVAVCDPDARRRCGQWADSLGNLELMKRLDGRVPFEGVAGYATPAELLADPAVDAVVIAAPTCLHADLTVAALRAGKHVLCEKPMALRPADCDRMAAAAEESGRTLMVGQCLRFWPQYELARRYVQEGRLGSVRYINLRRLGAAPEYSMGDWMLDPAQSGGALLDLHVHDIDFAHYLLGLPETIAARGVQSATGAVDHVVATCGYPGGAYAILEGGWLPQPWPFDMSFTIHGEHGTLDYSYRAGEDVRFYTGAAEPERLTCAGDAYEREDDYFVNCILGGRPVERCTPASTRASVVLAWLEHRAIETGKVIPVNERLREIWRS
ncbi:MAG: Gfo/Idh/MocA family oxidoreductase [Planctomycetota bacterium]